MNSFFTGQVVVCVRPPGDGQWKARTISGKLVCAHGPAMDEMCVIRGIDTTGRGLLIKGYLTTTKLKDGTEAGYDYTCFRPLVQYKNDISVLKALLVQAKEVRPLPAPWSHLPPMLHPLPVPHTSRP